MVASGSWRSSALAAGLAVAAVAGCDLVIGLADVPLAADAGASDASGASEAAADAPVDVGSADGADSGSSDGAIALADAGSDAGSSAEAGDASDGAPAPPIVLVPPSAGSTPLGLAQDDSFLYWTDDNANTLSRTDKVTGATTVLSGSTYFPRPVAADDAGIFWGDATGVWRCSKSSCSLTTMLVANEQSAAVADIAIDDVSVYWTEGFNTLLGARKAGTGQLAAQLWEIDASVNRVASDGQKVYFTAGDGYLRAGTPPTDASAGTLQAIGPSPYPTGGVAVDGTRVYWTLYDSVAGAVESVPRAALSQTPNPLAASLHDPVHLASDGTSVYWVGATTAAGTTGAIYGCAIGACNPTLLATGSDSVDAVVVDATAVYYADHGPSSSLSAGGIYKILK